MPDLSEHFNHKDFLCQCGTCEGTYRIHLGLVGALEMIWSHFQKPVKIVSGYRCEAYNEKLEGPKKSFHTRGKAAHIRAEEVPLEELFKFSRTVPELKGRGFYPQDNFVHVDTRQDESEEWVKEHGKYSPLTPERKKRYNLE